VNRFGLQVFRASDPRGPWKHNRTEKGLHDLSVLFDDDGKIYAVYGARTIRVVEFNRDLTALVPETDRVLIEREQGMGEGSQDDIPSAWPDRAGQFKTFQGVRYAPLPLQTPEVSREDLRTLTTSPSSSLGLVD
jgi:hypothetical protein